MVRVNLWGECCVGKDRAAVLSVVLFIHDYSKSSEMRHINSDILQEIILITSVFGAKRGIVNWLHAACGICKSWQMTFKTLKKQGDHIRRFVSHNSWTHWCSQVEWMQVIYIFLEFPGGSESDFHMWRVGWRESVEDRYQTNIKDQPPIYVFICETNAHLMGLSDDFDDWRIKERRVIDGPVTCSHIKDGE